MFWSLEFGVGRGGLPSLLLVVGIGIGLLASSSGLDLVMGGCGCCRMSHLAVSLAVLRPCGYRGALNQVLSVGLKWGVKRHKKRTAKLEASARSEPLSAARAT